MLLYNCIILYSIVHSTAAVKGIVTSANVAAVRTTRRKQLLVKKSAIILRSVYFSSRFIFYFKNNPFQTW